VGGRTKEGRGDKGGEGREGKGQWENDKN